MSGFDGFQRSTSRLVRRREAELGHQVERPEGRLGWEAAGGVGEAAVCLLQGQQGTDRLPGEDRRPHSSERLLRGLRRGEVPVIEEAGGRVFVRIQPAGERGADHGRASLGEDGPGREGQGGAGSGRCRPSSRAGDTHADEADGATAGFGALE